MLLRPLNTEKTLKEAADKRYTFAVQLAMRKDAIKKAIEKLFSTKVLKIQTITVPGHAKRVGRLRRESKPSSWKKAVVTTEKTLDLFSKTEAKI